MSSTNIRNNTRRLLVVVLVAAVSWKVFYPVATQPLRAKQEAIAKEKRALETLQNRLGIYTGYMQQIRETGKQCLQPDAMAASIRYQEWLRGLCESVGISDPNIAIKEPLAEEGIGATIQVTMASRASLAAAGELIDLLSNANIAHRMVRIEFRDWETTSNQIGITVDLDALSLQDNPTFDSTLLAQTIEPRGFGPFIEERKSFSRYMPPQPVVVESDGNSMSVSTEPMIAPRPDLLKTFQLVGVVQINGSPRALFRDKHESADIVVEQNQELRVDDFNALVASIDGDQVTLMQGQKLIQVSLGQTLREGIEATKNNEIF